VIIRLSILLFTFYITLTLCSATHTSQIHKSQYLANLDVTIMNTTTWATMANLSNPSRLEEVEVVIAESKAVAIYLTVTWQG
jgi:hypothetical protein